MNTTELIARNKELASLMTERATLNPVSCKLLNEAWRKDFPDEVAVARRILALVDALESAQATAAHSNRGWAEAHEQEARAEAAEKRIAELENDEVRQRLANAEHQLHMAELAKHNLRASRMAQFKKRKAAEKRISELEVRAIKFPPKVERDDSDGYWMLKGQRVSAANAAYYNEALKDVALALFAAGIKCEVKGGVRWLTLPKWSAFIPLILSGSHQAIFMILRNVARTRVSVVTTSCPILTRETGMR